MVLIGRKTPLSHLLLVVHLAGIVAVQVVRLLMRHLLLVVPGVPVILSRVLVMKSKVAQIGVDVRGLVMSVGVVVVRLVVVRSGILVVEGRIDVLLLIRHKFGVAGERLLAATFGALKRG